MFKLNLKKIVGVFLLIAAISISCNKDNSKVHFQLYEKAGQDFELIGLNNNTYEEVFDSIGIWHNDYQDFILNEIVNSRKSLLDTAEIQDFMLKKSINFFKSRGIDFKIDYLSFNQVNFNSLEAYIDSYSAKSKEIISSLHSLLREDDPKSLSHIYKKLNELKVEAFSIPNKGEFIIVGSAISIAKSSLEYWTENADSWTERILENNINNHNLPLNRPNRLLAKEPCKVNYYKLGGADVATGIRAGIGGAALGPGGAAAGAIAGAAGGSALNLLNQALSCEIKWWPF